MKCFIDSREKKRVQTGLKYYEKYNPVIFEMSVGDYVFHDNNVTVVFEYKTIEDFIGSVNDYRVFNQALNQSSLFDYHFVVVVGSEKDFRDAKDKLYRNTGLSFNNNKFNGALATLVEFTSVLQVKNESLAFDLMERVALKCCRDSPVVHRFPKSYGSPAYRFLVNNVSGLADKTSRRICEDLGLWCIGDVFDLSVDRLCGVRGIGRRRAESILRQILGLYE